MYVLLFVCLNIQISTIILARDSKFGKQISLYYTQLEFI